MNKNNRLIKSVKWPVAAMLCVFCCLQISIASAFYANFHGYVESNVIVRDTNGFQYGFFDKAEAVQQRNTLKFDLDVYPELMFGSERDTFQFEKVHFTYRGAYDSIFDLRNEAYGSIRRTGPSRFELGKDDIKFDNDLREAAADLTYTGAAGMSFLRVGRQLVSWGEAGGVTILDKINPSDNSYQMFFLDPDDMKIPLWMVRYNHSIAPSSKFGLNFDFVVVPDVRPQRFAPLDSSLAAPYSFIFQSLKGMKIIEDVNTDQTQWGGRVTANIGSYASLALSYYEGINSGPAIELRDWVIHPALRRPVPTTAAFTHPWTKTYGATFNSYIPPADLVIKGEFGLTQDAPVNLPGAAPDVTLGSPAIPGASPMVAKTYRLKNIGQGMLGVDKNVWMKWLSEAQVNLGAQWIRNHIFDWESVFDASATKKDIDLVTFTANWTWWNGRINPFLFIIYDTQGTYMTRGQIKWTIDKNWYAMWMTQAFWGDKKAKSSYAPLIGTSEMTFKVVFQW